MQLTPPGLGLLDHDRRGHRRRHGPARCRALHLVVDRHRGGPRRAGRARAWRPSEPFHFGAEGQTDGPAPRARRLRHVPRPSATRTATAGWCRRSSTTPSGGVTATIADPTSPPRRRRRAAFATLTERHRRELHVHCYRMLASFEEAEDAVQETFLRAWRGRDTFDGGSLFRAWLYRIATNVCLDMLRRRSAPADRGRARSPRCRGCSRTPTRCSTRSPRATTSPTRSPSSGRRSSWRSSPPSRCSRPASARR